MVIGWRTIKCFVDPTKHFSQLFTVTWNKIYLRFSYWLSMSSLTSTNSPSFSWKNFPPPTFSVVSPMLYIVSDYESDTIEDIVSINSLNILVPAIAQTHPLSLYLYLYLNKFNASTMRRSRGAMTSSRSKFKVLRICWGWLWVVGDASSALATSGGWKQGCTRRIIQTRVENCTIRLHTCRVNKKRGFTLQINEGWIFAIKLTLLPRNSASVSFSNLEL